MHPIDFGGQRSKVKVTLDIYGNKLVNTIETKPLHISLSNLQDMLTVPRLSVCACVRASVCPIVTLS